LRDSFIKLVTSTSTFNEKLSNIYIEISLEFMKVIFEGTSITKDPPELEKLQYTTLTRYSMKDSEMKISLMPFQMLSQVTRI
jgi:hypothetical protein